MKKALPIFALLPFAFARLAFADIVPIAVNDHVPVAFVVTNPCALEGGGSLLPPIVVVEGTIHFHGTVNLDTNTGKVTGSLMYNTAGINGNEFQIDLSTLPPSLVAGLHYNAIGTGQVQVTADLDDVKNKDKARIRFQLISATSEDNFFVTIRAFVMVDAAGNVTLHEPQVEAECKG